MSDEVIQKWYHVKKELDKARDKVLRQNGLGVHTWRDLEEDAAVLVSSYGARGVPMDDGETLLADARWKISRIRKQQPTEEARIT